jgi:hypothetical protein
MRTVLHWNVSASEILANIEVATPSKSTPGSPSRSTQSIPLYALTASSEGQCLAIVERFTRLVFTPVSE